MNSTPNRRRFLQLAGAGAASLGLAARGQAAPPAPAAHPAPVRLALASYTFHAFPLEQALAMTVRVGLKHICLKSNHLPLESTPEQIARIVAKVKDAGLELYGGGVIYMQNEKQVHQAFDYAKAAGMTTIVGSPAPDVLPLVDKLVRQFDIRVAIHNHGPGDKVYPTPHVAYEKIKDLDRRVGLCIDIGHTFRSGLDPAEAARQFADRLLDIHIKDVTAPTAAGKTVEMGRGAIDIPKFLRTLVEIKFAGFASFEFEKDAKDPLPGLAESVGYAHGAMAAM